MRKVLIVGRTRMRGNQRCIGGIDIINGTPIRLFDSNANYFNQQRKRKPGENRPHTRQPSPQRRSSERRSAVSRFVIVRLSFLRHVLWSMRFSASGRQHSARSRVCRSNRPGPGRWEMLVGWFLPWEAIHETRLDGVHTECRNACKNMVCN